jgi:hypothetical protein
MAQVYMDWTEDRKVQVKVFTGLRGKTVKVFERRDDAERFADSKMGKRGMILSTLDMSPEQLAAHKEREARFRERFNIVDEGE